MPRKPKAKTTPATPAEPEAAQAVELEEPAAQAELEVTDEPNLATPNVMQFPALMRRLSREQWEGLLLDAAGFNMTGKRSVSKECRRLAMRYAHDLGLSLLLGHLTPVGSGDSAKPRISRDGLVYLMHRGVPPDFEDLLDGITYDDERYPQFDEKAQDGRGEYSITVDVWKRGSAHPFRYTGRHGAQQHHKYKHWLDGVEVPPGWYPHPFAPEMAMKNAVYGALVLATNVAGYCPGLIADPHELAHLDGAPPAANVPGVNHTTGEITDLQALAAHLDDRIAGLGKGDQPAASSPGEGSGAPAMPEIPADPELEQAPADPALPF